MGRLILVFEDVDGEVDVTLALERSPAERLDASELTDAETAGFAALAAVDRAGFITGQRKTAHAVNLTDIDGETKH